MTPKRVTSGGVQLREGQHGLEETSQRRCNVAGNEGQHGLEETSQRR